MGVGSAKAGPQDWAPRLHSPTALSLPRSRRLPGFSSCSPGLQGAEACLSCPSAHFLIAPGWVCYVWGCNMGDDQVSPLQGEVPWGLFLHWGLLLRE